MNKRLALSQFYPMIEEVLRGGGEARLTVTGNSMAPMLRHRKDEVLLAAARLPLGKYDLPLYLREDGTFVLHRVVGVGPEGYIALGDNQIAKEYPVTDAQILAMVKGFWRGGKYWDCTQPIYRFYCRAWCFFLPVRRLWRLRGRIVPKLCRLLGVRGNER